MADQEIQRYEFYDDTAFGARERKHPEGDWVKHSDHLADRERQKLGHSVQVEALRKQVRQLTEDLVTARQGNHLDRALKAEAALAERDARIEALAGTLEAKAQEQADEFGNYVMADPADFSGDFKEGRAAAYEEAAGKLRSLSLSRSRRAASPPAPGEGDRPSQCDGIGV